MDTNASATTKMEKLIPVINKLQDVFNCIGSSAPIDLPQIAVVGAQSSGKSSVLENIVGRDFLPRGCDIVTRRPLIMQLVHTPAVPGQPEEWGEFLHKPGVQFPDFNNIRTEIEADTDRVAGDTKGINHQPINLKIFSPHVLNLTLVDLPGITKVPVKGQPKDIEEQIRHMIMTYIEKPSCIILAVSAANTDVANSDALKMASAVDRDGLRTLGVLTKLDLMDQGTNCVEVLMGRVVPLRLGYIGVINRSQKDISEKKTIRDALESERAYFMQHSAYRNMADRLGTPFLATTLNKLLIHHIKANLPALHRRVQELHAGKLKELQSYGTSNLNSNGDRGVLLLAVLTQFATDFNNIIDGKGTELATNEISGGARIHYIFSDVYSKAIGEVSYHDGLTEADIRTAIKNSSGYRPSLFVPEASFECIIKKQITRLQDPSIQCVELVFQELRRIAVQCERKELQRFPNLRAKLYEVVNSFFTDLQGPTLEMIRGLVNLELAYINTKHPEFIGGETAVRQNLQADGAQGGKAAAKGGAGGLLENFFGGSSEEKQGDAKQQLRGIPSSLRPSPTLSDREQREVQIIQTLLSSYYAIVKKSIVDSVPKSIMYFLVNRARNALQNHLVSKLYKDDLFENLLAENENLQKAREKCRSTIELLGKAMQILMEVREFTV